jgi:hypothetical protein
VNVIGISGLDNSVAFKRRELPDLDGREYRIAQASTRLPRSSRTTTLPRPADGLYADGFLGDRDASVSS